MNFQVRRRPLPKLIAAMTASTALIVSALAMTSPAHAAGAWAQQGSDIDGEAAGDQSGYSVTMSADGSTIAIGAPYNDDSGVNAGQVRVYTLDGSAWTQQGSDIDGEATGDYSGFSVAMSADGSTVAIGAPYNRSSAGQVRIYAWDDSTSAWTQQGGDIDGDAGGDYSGYDVAMSADGTTVAIGAPFKGGYTGQVRVYAWDDSTSSWTQRGGDIDGEATFDYSGYSVAMSADGDAVAIGAPGNDGTASSAGQVRVYTLSGGAWTQRGSDIDGEAIYDQSGSSVALSADGATVAIGAPANSDTGTGAGQVRVYTRSGSTWTQRGSDIDGDDTYASSGYSVALSADGSAVAIGAPDSYQTTAGYARVYTVSGSTWTQRGGDIDGEAVGDQFGYSVAMSAAGTTVTIGGIDNDTTGNGAGQVRVYAYTEAPTIAGVSPVAGPTAGGTAITITGANFTSGGSFGVTVGGSPCTSPTWDDSATIRCTTPARSAGASDVVVTNNDGQTVTSTGAYTYEAPAPVPPAPAPMPPPAFPPGAPASVTAIAGAASAAVSWTAPADPGSYAVSTYQVTAAPGGHSCMTAALTCEIGGLTNGTAYTFTVRALSGAGWGAPSAASNSVTPQAPPEPSILITGTRDGSTIRIDGTTTALTGTLTPWIKFPGQTTYTEGIARPAIIDNTFTWTRRANKKTYVYLTHGDVRSNTITIPAR